MRNRLRPWHRRAFAAIAAVLWLLGVEVLPNLHLATHHHDHTHAVDGSIVRLGHGHDEIERSHVHHDADDDHHDHDRESGELAGHEHREDGDCEELAELQVAHEHVAIEDDVVYLDHEHGEVEHDHSDGGHGHAFVEHDDEGDVADHHETATSVATGNQPHRHERGHGQLAIDQDVPLGHAALGIAHHATALHKPPPPLLAPVATPNVTTWTHAAPNERVSIAERSRPTARGPPVA